MAKISFIKHYFVESNKTEMLDISIVNVNKKFTTPKAKQDFLNTDWTIEEKLDGTKLTLVRNGAPYDPDYTKNWIVAYKGNILYPNEFKYIDRDKIKVHSIGISQYGLVHDILQKANPRLKDIKPNTEFFVEFLMNKDTLTRDYDNKHNLVLIGHSPTSFSTKNGILKTRPSDLITKDRNELAKLLGIDTPDVIFKGKMGSPEDFKKGIQKDSLKIVFEKYKDKFDKESPEKNFETIKDIFTGFNSRYGGKPEGVILTNKDGKIFKILSDDQHDKYTRDQKKLVYRMDKEKETEYFKQLREVGIKILDDMKIGSKTIKDSDFESILNRVSERVYNMEVPVKHEKKNNTKKQDDLYLTVKNLLKNNFEGNRWAMFLGKMRVLTKAHEYIIKKALEKYDGVLIVNVTGEESEVPKELKNQIIKDVFRDEIRNGIVEILDSSTGNIAGILRKIDKNIVAIVAGGDRMEDYEKQVSSNLNIKVDTTARDSEDSALKGGGELGTISASKAIEAIQADNEQLFRKMVPQKIWKYYDKYSKIFKNVTKEKKK